jgi:SAM-dependent methyltransferase
MYTAFRNSLTLLRQKWRQRPFNGLTRAEVFDKIYLRNFWGQSDDGSPYSGTGSHIDVLANPYVDNINAFLATLHKPSVVDLGCGDYSIGRRLNCHSYIGCDVSAVVLTSNRTRFPRVDFRRMDIVEDNLPPGDVGLLRQVLQHLDNASIAKLLEKPMPYKYLIVTEGLPAGQFTPNLDKPTGPNIRMQLGSGIDIKESPFCVKFEELDQFEVAGVGSRFPHIIRTTIYQL